VGADGDLITRGTLQYRVLRAFRRAGIDADRARGDHLARWSRLLLLHGCEFDNRLYFQVINHDLLGPLAWLDNLPPAGRPRGVVAGRIIISSACRKEQQP
jgi:hypothetical protein